MSDYLYTEQFKNPYIYYSPDIPSELLTLEFVYHAASHHYIATSAMGFDIETTNVIHGDHKRAYSYIQMTTINGVTILTRGWEDCRELWQRINDINRLGTAEVGRDNKTHRTRTCTRRILCFIHNFAFEWQYMKYRFPLMANEKKVGFSEVFLTEERKPLHAVFYDGIEVFCSMRLTNSSLANLAKTYCTTQKMKGDLDYSIPRNCSTPLTEAEVEYCVNDPRICWEYGQWFINTYVLTGLKYPLTSTGIVKNKTIARIPGRFKKDIRKACHSMQFNYNEYQLFSHFLFRGGYVHANAIYADRRIPGDWRCKDFKSSYPAVMCGAGGAYYPGDKFVRVDNPSFDLFDHRRLSRCVIAIIKFNKIRARYTHSIESASKCMELINPVIDNGRVWRADSLTVCINEVDYLNYLDFYSWEGDPEVVSMWETTRADLPFYLIESVVEYYEAKERLGVKLDSLVKGSEEYKYIKKERDISKANLNGLYGMCVQRVNLDQIYFSQEDARMVELRNAKEYEQAISNLYFIYSHGIYITTWARRNLLKTVCELERAGQAVAYCDTDSIYYMHTREAEEIFNRYNTQNEQYLIDFKFNHNIPSEALCNIGNFSDDGHYAAIKTLGAKRYLVEHEGGVKVTIAGLPKETLNEYTKSTDQDIWEVFNSSGMDIPAANSGKLTTSYWDEYTEDIVDGELMSELSCVALYDIPFNMSIEEVYLNFIFNIQKGDF